MTLWLSLLRSWLRPAPRLAMMDGLDLAPLRPEPSDKVIQRAREALKGSN